MASLISARGVRPDALGSQRPRILHVPDFVSSTGDEAVELCALAGLDLDDWQRFVIAHALSERADGQWAPFEVGVEVPRQNGKGGILEARELAGLFLLGEELIIHSAHEFSTASEALERMDQILEGCPELSRRVRVLKRSHGEEGVYLKSGQRLRYKTRTKSGGRGFSADCVILDEAMILPDAFLGALMPTLSARPNPQLWYTGSAVDKTRMEHGIVFARLRERALRGVDPALAYFGWSPAYERPEDLPAEAAADMSVWAEANPALGIRISAEHVSKEFRSMPPRTFAVERLGVGDWPDTSGAGDQEISDEAWDALADPGSKRTGPVCFAFDVTPDGRFAAIAVGGHRADGREHVEIVEHREGTAWVVPRLVELQSRHNPEAILGDDKGPSGALIADLENEGVDVDAVNLQQHAQACSSLIAAVTERSFRHLGTPELKAAVRGAAKRTLGDAWAWSRKSSSADISPLVALTLALRRAEIMRESVYEDRGLLVLGLD